MASYDVQSHWLPLLCVMLKAKPVGAYSSIIPVSYFSKSAYKSIVKSPELFFIFYLRLGQKKSNYFCLDIRFLIAWAASPHRLHMTCRLLVPAEVSKVQLLAFESGKPYVFYYIRCCSGQKVSCTASWEWSVVVKPWQSPVFFDSFQ